MLARYLLEKLGGDVTEVRPVELGFAPVDEQFLSKRDKACTSGDFSDAAFLPAKQFREAETVVIAAPYWDLSFPAALKQYFEQINVLGLTFGYSAGGEPVSLCKVKKLYYVTTAGGKILSDDHGYGYVKDLAQSFYKVGQTFYIKAEMLDIDGSDTEGILEKAKQQIDLLFPTP